MNGMNSKPCQSPDLNPLDLDERDVRGFSVEAIVIEDFCPADSAIDVTFLINSSDEYNAEHSVILPCIFDVFIQAFQFAWPCDPLNTSDTALFPWRCIMICVECDNRVRVLPPW